MPTRQTARDLVVEELRHQILSGRLAPGERLTAPAIAARFGVSQTPAREAIQLLQSEGLAVASPYKDTRVAELDADECEEIYVMRAALERLAAKLGTSRMDDSHVDMMCVHLEDMAEAVKERDIERYLRADRLFHGVHYGAADRPRLWDRIISLRHLCERYTRLSYQTLPYEMELAISSHGALIEHLRERDVERAADWVSSTLLRVPFRTRRILEPKTEETGHDRQASSGAGA